MRKFLWSVVHNTLLHPFLPFTGHLLDQAHDWTAEKAYGKGVKKA